MARAPFRKRLSAARQLIFNGSVKKEFIPALNPDGGVFFGNQGRLNDYADKMSQLQANVGWSFTANTSIAEPTAAVQIKLYQRKKDGDREEITQHEILDLLDAPNFMLTGEQLKQLHFTYMNFVGESYIYMRDGTGSFIPSKGHLPDALDIFPAHIAQFQLGVTYLDSIVRLGGNTYPIGAFIRDLNPDPEFPYFGRSIIKAAALAIDSDDQMKKWNRGIVANGARPSLIFNTNEPLSEEAYKRWKEQFVDDHTGEENAGKPLLIEGGDAKPYMLSPQDLDFLASRKFSKDEILAMWKVSPAVLGMFENANRANLDAAFYIHALNNVVPRIRQFVKQLNATLVKVYDPTYELDFVNPVPEDVEAKLNAADKGVDRWLTKDEIRNMYGEKPLPDKQGEQIIVQARGNAVTLEDVIDGKALAAATPAPGTEAQGTKQLRMKAIAAGQLPGFRDDLLLIPADPGCIMLDVEPMPVTQFVKDGAADLVDATEPGDHTMGAVGEQEAHVTLLFGLLDNGNVIKDKVDQVLAAPPSWSCDSVTIKQVSFFDCGDSYAIIGLVEKTPELVEAHERLTLLPNAQTFSEYTPHVTLAYVQHDAAVAGKWVMALGTEYNGKMLKAKGINYGDKPNGSTKSLGGVKKKSWRQMSASD